MGTGIVICAFSFLGSAGSWICDTFFGYSHTDEHEMVARVDSYLVNQKQTTRVQLGSRIPTNGYHYECWPLILYRSERDNGHDRIVTWQIYGSSQTVINQFGTVVNAAMDGPAVVVPMVPVPIPVPAPTLPTVRLDNLNYICPWNHTITHRTVIVPSQPRVNQLALLHQIDSDFVAGLSSRTILISGAPGIGKSAMGRLLTKHWSAHRPKLIEGFNPTLPGLLFSQDIENKRSDTATRLIVTMDEIDIAMAYSHQVHEPIHDYTCHAHNRIEFTRFWDNMKDIPNLVVICTTNESLINLQRDYPEYLRAGRMDHLVEFLSD